MNHIQAKCGHMVPAVGAPGSIARQRCERCYCAACRERLLAYDEELVRRINACTDPEEEEQLLGRKAVVEMVLTATES